MKYLNKCLYGPTCVSMCLCVFRICWILTFRLARQCDKQRVWSEDYSSLQAKHLWIKWCRGEETKVSCEFKGVCVCMRAHVHVCRSRGTGQDPVKRQITWGEDNLKIRKTLHDEKKVVEEWMQQDKDRNRREAGNKEVTGGFSKMK